MGPSESPNETLKPRIVEGAFWNCPEGLVVATECLGHSYQTVVGGRRLTLHLPSLPVENTTTLPRLAAPETYYETPPRHPSDEPAGWGFVTYSRGGVPQSALIERVGFRFEVPDTDVEAMAACTAIERDLTGWWERVAMWLDTFTELDLRQLGRPKPEGLGNRFLTRTKRDDGSIGPLSWMSSSEAPFPSLIEVPDREILQSSFELAGLGVELPDAWSYLREARSWLNSGETRRAVIDACTAAEIALARQVRQLLPVASENTIQRTIRDCQGIAGVAEYVSLNAVRTESMKAIAGRLAGPRNRAAHAGTKPDLATAKKALEIAAKIVEHALPRHSLIPKPSSPRPGTSCQAL